MRNPFLSKILIGLMIVFSISSCSKETTNTTPSIDVNKTGVLTCKINGTLWQSEVSTSIAFMEDSNKLAVMGFKKNGNDTNYVVLSMKLLPTKTGKYEGTANIVFGNYVMHLPNKSEEAQLDMMLNYVTTYTINLTKYDPINRRVSGTFSNIQKAPAGTGKPDYIITEGKFTDVQMSY